MKKLNSKMLGLIGGVAALALVGTGYAAWTFSADADASASAGAVITDVETDGTLTVSNASFYLVIDQNFLGFATTNTATASDISSVTLTYTGSDEAVNETINFTASYTNALSEYINVTGGSLASASKAYTGTAITNVYTLPTVSWVDGKKPQTQTAYDAMVTAIGSKSVSFSFGAAVAA